MSVRLRLTLWYTAILSATLLLLGLGLYLFTHYIYYDGLKTDLRDQAENIRSKISARPAAVTWDGNLIFDLAIPGKELLRTNNIYIQVNNLNNGNLFRSSNLQQIGIKFPDLSESKVQHVLEEESLMETVKVESMDFMIYSLPVYVKQVPSGNVQLAGMIQAGLYLEPYDRIFVLLRWILLGTGVLAIALAASVGWFLSRKAFRPIEQLIVSAEQIGKGEDLGRRIGYSGPMDEIGRLTDTINGMLGRLQTTYSELEEANRTQRRFVSDASHELRTPLTTIRGNVDLLEKVWKRTAELASPDEKEHMQMDLSLEAMRDIAGEAERMSRLVNDLLSLARADAGFQMLKTDLPMKPIIEEVIRKAHLLPRSAAWVAGDLSALDGAVVYGNQDYLQQLVFIFIENAFKYTDTGEVRLDALRYDGQIGIRIEDTGIGMDKEEIPHIFERFYRADPSRGKKSGTGLGLSIAKWIIDEHRGSIEVKTMKEVGTTFVIWLPLAQERLEVVAPDGVPAVE